MKIFIVDADGKRIRPKHKIPKPKPIKPKQTKYSPTSRDLNKLEDAIFANEKFRVEFLNIVSSWIKKSLNSGDPYPTLDGYLRYHKPRRQGVLLYCWSGLRWRPSEDGTRVIVAHESNKYLS